MRFTGKVRCECESGTYDSLVMSPVTALGPVSPCAHRGGVEGGVSDSHVYQTVQIPAGHIS